MRVAFCAYDGANVINGVNTVLLSLAPALQSRGCEVEVHLLAWAERERCTTWPRLEQLGVRVRPIPTLPCFTEHHTRALLSAFSDDPPDVFVPNSMPAGYFAARWLREAGVATIGVLHNDDAEYEAIQQQFVRGDPAYAVSGLVCISSYLYEQARRGRVTRTALRQIEHGVSVPPTSASAPRDELQLVYAGRLEEQGKRISDTARAIASAALTVPGVTGTIYGSGSAESHVRAIIRDAGAERRVAMGGLVDPAELRARFLEAHVLVLLSDHEGWPMSVLEAMACGAVPVCLRTRSGVTELVEDGVTGLLVSDRGESFVRAVRRLREEPGLWARLSANARRRVAERYSLDRCADAWMDFMSELRHDSPLRPVHAPRRLHLPPHDSRLAESDPRQPAAWLRIARRARRSLAGVLD